MTNEFRYALQPYKRTSDRHQCPACGHKGEFSLYIDTETGKPLHPSVGKCNREQKCGYHYRPSEYFKDNPNAKPQDDWKPAYVKPTSQYVLEINYLPSSLLIPDTHRDRNNLFRFMAKEFGEVEANRVFDAYHVGTSKHWRNHDGLATSFPQVDELGKLRRIKVIAYNPTTGKRMKKNDTLHVWIEKRKAYVIDTLPTDKVWWADKPVLNNYELNLVQCLFGCHLIKDASRVGIVESEKSALICSILMPEITWIATGGCNGCKWTESAVFQPLIGKRVVLYPDSGMFAKWEEKAAILRNGGVDVTVSRACEGLPDNWDIADVLLRERHAKKGMTIGEVLAYATEIGVINQIHVNV